MDTSDIALGARPRRQRAGIVTVLLLGACWSLGAHAGWDFQPSFRTSAIYTDNLGLAPSGQEVGEAVFEIVPRLAWTRDDPRVQADIKYDLQYIAYSDFSGENEVFHQLDAALTAELLPETIFLDIDSAISQQLVDPERPFSNNNILITDNRVDAIEYNLAPYFRRSLGLFAEALLRYDYGVVDYDSDIIEDAERHLAEASLTSPASDQGVTWGVSYTFLRQEYDVSMPVEYGDAGAELGYWMSPRLRIFASGGVESNFVESRSNADLDEPYYLGGFNWLIGSRHSLYASLADRFYGRTLEAEWTYELRRIVAALEYSDRGGTNTGVRLDRRRVGVDLPEDGLNRPGDTDVFVRRRLQASMKYTRTRSELDLRAWAERREQRTTEEGVALGDEETVGFGADWRWDIGSRTAVSIGAGWSRSDFDDGQADAELGRVRLGASYELGTKTGLRLEYDYQRGNSGIGTFDFTENRLGFYARRSFK